MNQQKNILLVDDNLINLQVVSSFLYDQNYKVFFAEDGLSALHVLEDAPIDLILLDIMMPKMDGIETCKKIKENERTKEIPVVFLTAKSQSKDIVEGFQAGGVDYIVKPFNGEELKMRIKTHIELSDARKTIIKYHKTRDRIYSILAHDIRSPLSSIAMFLDGLEGKYIDTSGANYERLISEISASTKNTLSLIQNILEWTQTQNDSIKLSPENIDIKNLIEKCITLLILNINNKKITINIKNLQHSEIFVDESTISNVFRNLISNAVKFSQRGGEINIFSYENGQYINIVVQDYGIGISSEIQKKIFEKDEHHTSRGTENEKGTGLGIYMVKDFVKLNGGFIRVDSEVNSGAIFTVSLPKSQKNL